MQLVQLRNDIKQIHEASGEVVGISYDDVPVLAKFAKQSKIEYPLLSDGDSKVIDAYQVRNKDAAVAKLAFHTRSRSW
jgi:peroxiredoxin